MADYSDTRQVPPTFVSAGSTIPSQSENNTTLNMPPRGASGMMPVIIVVAVLAIVGMVAWRVMDDDVAVTPAPAPVAQTTAPETTAPAATEPALAPVQTAPEPTPSAVPEGDPAPMTPPVGDPPANLPATPPTAAPAP